MGFKEDDRIIYKEIANAYGERTSQLLKETIERDKITNGTH
jgi:hypothetical protein